MAERIITDSRGQRWDVIQHGEQGTVTFRHQSGSELTAEVDGSVDGLSSDELLAALDDARHSAGLEGVGRGGLDVAFDADGYETGR